LFLRLLNELKRRHTQPPSPQTYCHYYGGNGRWAKSKGKIRAFGHENGTKSVRTTVENCVQLGIEHLTLYAFSTENWKRPKLEVKTLMRLLISSLKKEIKTLQENNIRLNAIGDIKTLPTKVYNELIHVADATKSNTKMTLNLALNYGSRDELTQMVQKNWRKNQK